jgi:hypothetical protein
VRARYPVAVAICVAIIAAVIWLLRADRRELTGAEQTSSLKRGRSRASLGDPRANGRDGSAPTSSEPTFERARREAVARFNGDVTTRVQLCANELGGSGAAPQLRDVRLVFEHHAELSTPEFQTLVVKEISIIDVGGLSAAARDCIRRATGMQLRIDVPADQLPSDARTFDLLVKLPVP